MSTTSDNDIDVSDTGTDDFVDTLLALDVDAEEVECLRGNHPENPHDHYERFVKRWLQMREIPGWARDGDVQVFTPASAMLGVVFGKENDLNLEIVGNLSHLMDISNEELVKTPILFAQVCEPYWTAILPASEGIQLVTVSESGDVYHATKMETRLDWFAHPAKQAQWLPRFSKTHYTMFFEDDDDIEDEGKLRDKLANVFESIAHVFERYSEEVTEWFRHPAAEEVFEATESVEATYTEDGYEHAVTVRAPAGTDLPPGTTGTLTFSGSTWAAKPAEAVREEYSRAFAIKLDLSDEMVIPLFGRWQAMREVHVPANVTLETLVDDFVSAVNRMKVVAVENVKDWSPSDPTGLLYSESGEDYIALGSTWVRDVFESTAKELDRGMDEALIDEGVVCEVDRASGALRKALQDAEGVDNERPMVWVVPIGKTSQNVETIRNVEEVATDLLDGGEL